MKTSPLWRLFCLFLGAATLATAERIDLNGNWTFSIHGRAHKTIQVPSTYLPVGGATLERHFDLRIPADGGRALLHFEGIAMTAAVSVNGHGAGDFGPYTPFTIDVTGQVHDGANKLRVELTDLGGFPPWGRDWVTAFPRMAGIIRDVYLDWKPAVYIDNARLDYRLVDRYTNADCELHVWVVNSTNQPADLELAGQVRGHDQQHAFSKRIRAAPGISEHTLAFDARAVRLWSPDAPNTYDLSVDLRGSQAKPDRFSALTGFRELAARGQDFYLNGEKFFLKGVFRHDIYGLQGHTMTRGQMETEIADIKSLGCNFLRLGHYPQHRYLTELAARHGLFTSGEPPIFGLPKMDQTDPNVVAGAKFCLGGLIRRDWNNPAAAVWIISNEVGTDLGYMKEMASFVRGLDPNELVSIVDHTKFTAENVPWQRLREAKIDFMSHNAYGSGLNGSYEKLAPLLPADMPYVISEWGGPTTYVNLLREGRYFIEHSSMARDAGPRIAGIWFWEYQDIPMQRWTEEGLLHWSLVDQFRRPYETYYALKTLYTGKTEMPPRGRLLVAPADHQLPRPLGPFENHAGYTMIDLSAVLNSDRIVEALRPVSPLAFPEGLATGKVVVGGLPFLLNERLVMLSEKEPSVRINLGKAAHEIEFLGHVCFNSIRKPAPVIYPPLPHLAEGFPEHETPPLFKGYPQAGEFGEAVAEYVIHYEDGGREAIPLENGIHFADYRLFFGLSPIDAVAVETERVVDYGGTHGAKTYQLRLFSYRPKRPSTRISHIDFNLRDTAYVPMLAAITVHDDQPELHGSQEQR